jgi:hypothetical protein
LLHEPSLRRGIGFEEPEEQLVDKRSTKGRVGLATRDASARFREIAVTTPEGKILWEGPPEIPRE